jgi:hypothetical protein
MTHSKADMDPEDQPTSPLTLDSFDPLRDAETVLDRDMDPHDESDVGVVDPRNALGSTDTSVIKGGPEDPGEVGG